MARRRELKISLILSLAIVANAAAILSFGGCASATSAARIEASAADPRLNSLRAIADKTLPWQTPMPPVKPGEWRNYWREDEESPAQYLADHPRTITTERRILYLQPIGEFTPTQESNHQIIREFLGIYFNSQVIILPTLTLANLPSSVKREVNKSVSLRVIELTDRFLTARLPENGWGIMALCSPDLFKSDGISGLYGDTLLHGRTGAISWHHLGDDLSLMLKGASHESSHLLSLKHCTRFECNLNGRITVAEFRRAPLFLCPDCLVKLGLSAPIDIPQRYQHLADFCARYNLPREAAFYRNVATAVKRNENTISVSVD